jgi:hypothetical protein
MCLGTLPTSTGSTDAHRLQDMTALKARRYCRVVKAFNFHLIAARKMLEVALVSSVRKLLTTLIAIVRIHKPWYVTLH